jgi:hypothetical protein
VFLHLGISSGEFIYFLDPIEMDDVISSFILHKKVFTLSYCIRGFPQSISDQCQRNPK